MARWKPRTAMRQNVVTYLKRSTKLPNFLIIGAGKCGTTSLWAYLDQHPDICMSRIKEPSFFSMDETWARGWEWYERLYAQCSGAAARGEASNSYSATESYPDTIARIRESLPGVKLIYSVRHPRARTESDYMQRSKISDIAFSDFLRRDPLYHDKNCYLRTYERYAEAVGADNILVLFYEDLRADPAAVARRCFAFLGVDPEVTVDVGTAHGQSADHRVFVPGLGALRRSRAYTDLSLYIPGVVKRAFRPLVSTTRQIARPEWSAADEAWFRAEFEERSRAFLAAMGRPNDEWRW